MLVRDRIHLALACLPFLGLLEDGLVVGGQVAAALFAVQPLPFGAVGIPLGLLSGCRTDLVSRDTLDERLHAGADETADDAAEHRCRECDADEHGRWASSLGLGEFSHLGFPSSWRFVVVRLPMNPSSMRRGPGEITEVPTSSASGVPMNPGGRPFETSGPR